MLERTKVFIGLPSLMGMTKLCCRSGDYKEKTHRSAAWPRPVVARVRFQPREVLAQRPPALECSSKLKLLRKGIREMGSESRLSGREERRLPIMLEVSLARAGPANTETCERTFTDNISPHGIRLQSTKGWRMGEQAEVTPMKGEIAMLGEVVYCQRVGSDRFFLGLKFRHNHIPWTILQRFNGLTHTDILGAMRWSDNDASWRNKT